MSCRPILFTSFLLTPFLLAASDRIPLAGTWRFQLDAQNQGRAERWYDRTLAADSIFLPGSTDEAGKGVKVVEPETGWLTRPYKYEGAAWYQKDVVIPPTWAGKRILLFLERPHWETEVWVDGRNFGSQNSLSTPHQYDLTRALSPGPHHITICVDNSYKIDVGTRAHSVTDHTQTNWNGIVGAIELRAAPAVSIESVAVYPDIAAKQVRIAVTLHNITASPAAGTLTADVAGLTGAHAATWVRDIVGSQTAELTVPMPEARLWDEWAGEIYQLMLTVFDDRVEIPVSLRQISTRGTQFLLNGRPVFLRGTLECNIFPLTGYPSTKVEDWERIFRIARSYGLNAFRFHSNCPPEAAFIAADRAGFLLHVELPVWSSAVGKDPKLDDFMRAEGFRILKAYGNHPSFTMLCLGNELVGDDAFMDGLVAEFKQSDPRRLYTFSADHRRRLPGATSDYYVTQQTSAGRLRINGTRFEKTMDGTDHDFSAAAQPVTVPLVTHEMGQWAVFPSYDELAKYTGVLKPRNLEPFRAQLEARGMLDQAHDFQLASGRFSWAIYKEDMEAALRTPHYGGFFLLQLEDFPGQGEALVGLLDSFWDSKGILTPEEFRRFSNQTVPLARMKKFVWTSDETFTARIDVAHYGKQPIEAAHTLWSLNYDSGELPPANLPLGSVTTLGEISVPLSKYTRATHLKLAVHVSPDAQNEWDLWVYPKSLSTEPPPGVLVTSAFDDSAKAALAAGRSVVLLAPGLQPMRFTPVFWSNAFFGTQPGTLGIFCDPAHPALRQFPTSRHSDWQWWELTEGAHAYILDDTAPAFRPIVQVIDDFHRNHKLGAVIEASVGNGKLLAVSLDIATHLDARPVARQLRRSLLDYAASADFHPRQNLTVAQVEALLSK
jgi:hypothetical protein